MWQVVVVFLISLSLSLPLSAAENVVAQFEQGTGLENVGIIGVEQTTDEGHVGPQAITSDANGRLHLLDQNNGRVLVLGMDGSMQGAYELPGALPVSDLVAVGDTLYAWADGPVPLKTGDTQLLSASGDPPVAALAAFASVGSVQATPSDDLLSSSIELLSSAQPNEPVLSNVSTGTGETIPVTTTISPERVSAEIADPAGDVLARIDLPTGTLGAVVPMYLSSDEVFYLLIETYAGTGSFAPSLNVVSFNAEGQQAGYFAVPLEGAADIPRRFVTITPDGRVFALRNEQNRSLVLELSLTEGPLRWGSSIDIGSGGETVAAPASQSRRAMLEVANELENVAWAVTASAHDPNPRSCVVSGAARLSRPWYIDGKVGAIVSSIPYNWGGMVSVAKFNQDLAAGRLAGNVCTSDPGLMANTTGNDCSGHVSVIWGLPTKYSTRSLADVSRPVVMPQTNLRTGDILNKAGSHVRVFVRYLPNGFVETSESSIICNGKTGRTCRSTYLLSTMLATRYVGLRFVGVTE
jgi:hypothetical protein